MKVSKRVRAASVLSMLLIGFTLLFGLAGCVLQTKEGEVEKMEDILVIKGGTLIDGRGGEPRKNVNIVIQDGKIIKVSTKLERRYLQGAKIIDASGKFIIPGLIDTHVHIGGSAGASISPEEFAPEQIEKNLKAYLYNGVTTILSVGDMKDYILERKRLEREGKLLSPRIFAVGPIFTAPGGHPAGTIYKGHDFLIESATRQVSDKQAKEEARKLIEEGVDAIKAVYDGGKWVGEEIPKLSYEALKAIIDEAHRHGRRVFVHIGEAKDAVEAIKAGADGIEHMRANNDIAFEEMLKLAVAQATFLTPTLSVYEAFAKIANDPNFLKGYDTAGSVSAIVLKSLRSPESYLQSLRADPESARRFQQEHEATIANLRRAHEAGVKITLGTDAGNPAVFHGLSALRELELLVEAGLSPMHAIMAATKVAAQKLGVEDKLGTIEEGKAADLVILNANPLEDISNVRKIELVIKRGIAYTRVELAIHEEELAEEEGIETEAPKEEIEASEGEVEGEVEVEVKPPTMEVQKTDLAKVEELFKEGRALLYNASTKEELFKAKELLEKSKSILEELTGKGKVAEHLVLYERAQIEYELGTWFEANKDHKGALKSFESALSLAEESIKLNDSFSASHRLLAESLMRLFDFKGWQFAAANGSKAKKEAEKALKLDLQDAEAHIALGTWYLFTPKMFGGSIDKALNSFQKAEKLAGDEHQRFLANIWLGEAYLKKKDKEKAKIHFQRALEIYPHSYWAKERLEALP